MSDAAAHPRVLELPREDDGLATGTAAVRRLQELLPAFLENVATEAGADGFVVVLDGTVDSTVAATMATDALGPDSVVGLVTPAGLTDEARSRDAEAVASMLGIECHRLQIHPVVAAFQRVVGTAGEPTDDLVAMQNAGERFRMACAYYVANTRNHLVVGSVNRTDRLLGSVAKHGENGVDVDLLGDLYRTEVRALGSGLDLPAEILDRPARRLGHAEESDAAKLGVDTRTLDSLLRLSIDEGHSESAVADRLDVPQQTVCRVGKWCASTRHKRHHPPKPSMR